MKLNIVIKNFLFSKNSEFFFGHILETLYGVFFLMILPIWIKQPVCQISAVFDRVYVLKINF